MGNFFTNALEKLGKRDKRVLLIGMYAAGKTTWLYKTRAILGMQPPVTTVPSCFWLNVETIDFNGLNVTAFDVGGIDKMRIMLKHYYPGTDGVIFMVDADDIYTERMDEACRHLHLTLCDMAEHAAKCPVLILANKMDLIQSKREQRLEFIQRAMGMERAVDMNRAEMKEIQPFTLLKCVPNDVFDLILEYSVYVERGPSVRIQPYHLFHPNSRKINALHDDVQIMQTICDYLPGPYTYYNLPSTNYNVMGCCAASGDGCAESVEWITKAMHDKKRR